MLGVLCLFLLSGHGFPHGLLRPRQDCVSPSQPNPIADQYPNSITGTVNGTLVLIPMSLEAVRQIIPHPILVDAYRTILPGFPKDKYPALLQSVQDHDLRFNGSSVPGVVDFTVGSLLVATPLISSNRSQRSSFEYPFVDLSGDGRTAYRWAVTQLITPDRPIARGGSEAYGTTVHDTQFDPPCEAYGTVADNSSTTYFKGSVQIDGIWTQVLSLSFKTTNESGIAGLSDFIENAVSQPFFSDGDICDVQPRLFNTSISQRLFRPRKVKGTVKALPPAHPDESVWEQVWGVQVDTAMVEFWPSPRCAELFPTF